MLLFEARFFSVACGFISRMSERKKEERLRKMLFCVFFGRIWKFVLKFARKSKLGIV